MPTKATGYTLLTIGIIVIIFSLINAIQVFSGRQEPLPLFNFPAITMNLSSQAMPGIQLPPLEVASAEMINKTLNVFSYLFLMGFVASIGYKFASLGVMLVRPIVVKLNSVTEALDPKSV